MQIWLTVRASTHQSQPSDSGLVPRPATLANLPLQSKHLVRTIYCTSGRRRILLSTPDWARTSNLRFRRPVLYPIELRVLKGLTSIRFWRLLPVLLPFVKNGYDRSVKCRAVVRNAAKSSLTCYREAQQWHILHAASLRQNPPRRSKTTPSRKPRFPLWLHSGTGQWAKKIKGRVFYFGTNKDAALEEYIRVKDDQGGEGGQSPF